MTTSYVAGNFSGYGNLAAAQQVATKIDSAQALFTQDDLNFIAHHYIHTEHDQLITASAGLAYLWHRTRFSVDLVAGSGLRTGPDNRSSLPFYEQVNLGASHGFTLPRFGKVEARFDIINVLDNNYVIRDGTGIGVFAKQFGPPIGFFGGLKKEF